MERATLPAIRRLRRRDLAASLDLWGRTPGVGVSHGDDLSSLRRFLRRNRSLCFVASRGSQVVGTVLCGCDGRRGYIYHLAIDENQRRGGLARRLVARVLEELARRGIGRCHAMVFADNGLAQSFWGGTGWRKRDDIGLYSCDVEDRP